ncbi:PREDICTED: poly [ADP-ribose] polymerase 14-like [Cyprinodon variegatus]|uniref:poly [ADP-ribose] polymerase 14-like n=1 Tax=Cyprinodon variegatus TaxID=28743 RepID=UPI000742B032|nr:PREDICTED: poly [ADP-ribose] polymerase 14-like [Cyprinodon variegatus]
MLVESISGLDENDFSLVMRESNMAVVTFINPTDADKFITMSQTSTKMKRQGIKAWPIGEVKMLQGESFAPAVKDTNSDPSTAVLLENVSENLSEDLLQMLVERTSGLEENDFSLVIFKESKMAVVTFINPTDAEKFISVSQTNSKMRNQGLTARRLGAAKSIKIECVPPTVVKDTIELYFEKNWELPEHILMIPKEQAAIVTFKDPEVVKRICIKEEHDIRFFSVKLYPYYEELGTALYSKGQHVWNMPEPFTEKVQSQIWKFLQMKKMLQSINDQMRPHFCSIDFDHPDVKLRPLSCFLRQKGLTAKDIDNWAGLARTAFCKLMSEYSAFECDVNAEAWKTAEREVCSIVKEDALVDFDPSREVVTIACRADDMKKIRAPVENFILKLMSQIEQETKSITENMDISPAYHYILVDQGLQKAALDITTELKISYNEGTEKLSITGLPAEVYKTKSWILEIKMKFKQKNLNLPPGLLEYLQTVDPMDMSISLFTSQGISAIYGIDPTGIFLLGSSDRALADAESKMKKDLSEQNLDVRDQEVLKRQDWMDLCRNLLDTYNVSNKKTVIIWIDQERRDKVTVVGFTIPVKEVSLSLQEFIEDYSQVCEKVCVESCAVAQFIERKKENWSKIAKDYNVSINFDPERAKINISGAHLHVQIVGSHLKELANSLIADTLTIAKPGAKKYFQSHGSIFLTAVMADFSCVVMLQQDPRDPGSITQIHPVDNNEARVRVVAGVDGVPLKFTMRFPQHEGERNKGSAGSGMFNRLPHSGLTINQGRGNISSKTCFSKDLSGKGVMQRYVQREAALKQILDPLKQTSGTSIRGTSVKQQNRTGLFLDKEEFDPAVFHLCAENQRNLSLAKRKISDLILHEQVQRTIDDQYINQLSQEDIKELNSLQKELTVSIRLERGQEDQEPRIHLEGLTRDVLTAESEIRNIIRRLERKENFSNKGPLVHEQVDSIFHHQFDSYGPPSFEELEEACRIKQSVMRKTKRTTFNANQGLTMDVSCNGWKQMGLMRKDLIINDASLPQHWEDMKDSIVKQVPLTAGSQEYNDVVAELTKNGLYLNIRKIERIQNTTLWQSYLLQKKQMEVKNKHTNNEKLLYYGTGADSIDLINSKGFNRSYTRQNVKSHCTGYSTIQGAMYHGTRADSIDMINSRSFNYAVMDNSYLGQHGAMYGNGSYFTVDPAYSARSFAQPDTQGHKRMYQARVLVGDYTQGRSGMIAPPAKTGPSADLYDSVTDSLIHPSMFIIFYDTQAYPEYLITFR